MSDYSRKITPICCHAYRVNRLWNEAENRCVTITQLRLANKKTTVCHAYQINRLR